MTPTLVCGFECGLLQAPSPHWSSGAGTPSLSTATVRSGTYALRVNPSAAAAYGNCPLPVAQTTNVARFYINVATAPGANRMLAAFTNDTTNEWVGIAYNSSDGKVYNAYRVGTTITLGSVGASLSAGWNLIDIEVVSAGATWTIDVTVNGTALTQLSFAEGALRSQQRFLAGTPDNATMDVFYDDFMFSNTAADYPLGAGKVLGFSPAADGTHTSTSTHILKGTTGAPTGGGAITSATTDSFNWVNRKPLGGGATDATRLINQATAASTEYVEHTIEQTTETTDPRGVEVCVATRAAGTQAANAAYKWIKPGGAEAGILTITNWTTTDSFSHVQFPNDPDGSPWTVANFNGLKLRWGYSSDATPDVYNRGILLEVEFPPAVTDVVVTPGTASLATSTFAPTVQTPVTVTPGTASLSLSSFAPSVTVGVNVVPATASLTSTTFAPNVQTPVTVTPGVASLVTSTFAPGVTVGIRVVPGTASVVLSTFAPTVLIPVISTPGTAAVVTSTFAPAVTSSNNQVAVPGIASIAISSFAPSVQTPVSSVPATASISVTTFAPTISANGNQVATPGTYTMTTTAFAPTVVNPQSSTPNTASMTITTFAPAVRVPVVSTPGTAALTTSRFAPTVLVPVTSVPGTAVLALTSFAPGVTATANVTVSPSNAALTITTYAPSVVVLGTSAGLGTVTGAVSAVGTATGAVAVVGTVTAVVTVLGSSSGADGSVGSVSGVEGSVGTASGSEATTP